MQSPRPTVELAVLAEPNGALELQLATQHHDATFLRVGHQQASNGIKHQVLRQQESDLRRAARPDDVPIAVDFADLVAFGVDVRDDECIVLGLDGVRRVHRRRQLERLLKQFVVVIVSAGDVVQEQPIADLPHRDEKASACQRHRVRRVAAGLDEQADLVGRPDVDLPDTATCPVGDEELRRVAAGDDVVRVSELADDDVGEPFERMFVGEHGNDVGVLTSDEEPAVDLRYAAEEANTTASEVEIELQKTFTHTC